MAKLPRIFQKIFGATAPGVGAGGIGQFGSLAAGSPALTTDLSVLQALSNYSDGWLSAIIGNNSPAIEDMNSLFFLITNQLAYLMQAGVAEWDTSTIYYTNSIVNYQGFLYQSNTDGNTGNNPASDSVNWASYSTTSSGIIISGACLSAPSGYALCDGSAESRTSKLGLFNSLTIRVTGNTGATSNIMYS